MEADTLHARVYDPTDVLPQLILIADRFTDRQVAHRTIGAVQAGVEWVHLRDHDAADEVFWETGRVMVGRLRRASERVLVSINRQPAVAEEWRCGVHVGKRGPAVAEAVALMNRGGPTGYSAHDVPSAFQAEADGANYVVFGHVFETRSKTELPPKGTGLLAEVCSALAIPVYAVGGVRSENILECMEAGAHGVAVVSGILNASDPSRAAADLLLQLEVARQTAPDRR